MTSRPASSTPLPALAREECPFDEFSYDQLSSGPISVSIPDNEPAGVFVGWVQTAEAGLLIEDVIVDVDLTHTYAGDIALGVYYDTNNDNIGDVGPVMLMCTPGIVGCDFEGCCGCAGDLAGTYRFSDAATGVLGEVECASVLPTGCYAVDPSYGPLHGLNGLDDGGRFILYAWDWEGGDTGTVEGFTVWVKQGCNHPVLNVPGDYPTVQGALDAACGGDTIRIAPGSYGDAIRDMQFKGVTIEAAVPSSPPLLGTIDLIDAGRGGLHDLIADHVSVRAHNPFEVTNLATDDLYALVGGGRLTVADCQLGSLEYHGYRVQVESTRAGWMTFDVQDEVMLLDSATGPVRIDFFGSGAAVIRGNTFVQTVVTEPVVLGVLDFGREVELHANLVVGAVDGTSTGVELDGEVSAPPVMATCNDVWRCAQTWAGIADPTGTNGNFSADPRLCSEPARDFHLAAGSPCLPGHHPQGTDCGQIGAYGQGCTDPVAVEEGSGPERPWAHATPNPARGQVTFSLAGGMEEARLRIFDAAGRMVRTLAASPARGTRQVRWDQRNDAGDAVPAGVYFYKANVGRGEVTRQLIVLR